MSVKVSRVSNASHWFISFLQADTEISREDQTKINKFSRLNMRAHDLRGHIKKLRDDLDSLQDAQQLIEESFGEGLKLFIGEALIDVDEETATEYHEKLVEEKGEDLDKKKDELEEIEEEMKDLKSYLYARFGNSINLEEEWAASVLEDI